MIPLWAAAAWALDLDEARHRAQDRASDVQRAQHELDAATGEARAWTGRALPQIAGFANASTGAGLTAFGFERPVATQVGVGVRGQWTVLDPATWSAASAARRTRRGQQATLAWARVTARRDATVTFADAVAATEIERALARAATDAAQAAEAVRSRAEAQLISSADAARAHAEAQITKARATEARSAVASTCAALQGLIHLEVTGYCTLSSSQWDGPSEASGPHPALTAAAEALGAARSEATRAVTTHGPTATLDGELAQYTIPGSGSGPGWSAGARVELPFSGATTGVSETRAARARTRLAELELEEQRLRLQVALVSAERGVETARATLEARQRSEEAAVEAQRQVDERYRAGVASLSDWLDARRTRLDAAVELARARAVERTAVAELEAARGVW